MEKIMPMAAPSSDTVIHSSVQGKPMMCLQSLAQARLRCLQSLVQEKLLSHFHSPTPVSMLLCLWIPAQERPPLCPSLRSLAHRAPLCLILESPALEGLPLLLLILQNLVQEGLHSPGPRLVFQMEPLLPCSQHLAQRGALCPPSMCTAQRGPLCPCSRLLTPRGPFFWCLQVSALRAA